MSRTAACTFLVVSVALAGCGDDSGSGGSGGGASTTAAGPGSGTGMGTGMGTGSSTTASATTGSSTAATTGATTGAGSTASTGGGGAAFGEACTGNADCASGVCHNFPNQGGMLCTLTCSEDMDCPPPSSGCNNMGYCRPN